MSPAESMIQEMEKNVAALEQKREAASRQEVLADSQLRQAQANTAFIMGQLQQAKVMLNRAHQMRAEKEEPKPVSEAVEQAPKPKLHNIVGSMRSAPVAPRRDPNPFRDVAGTHP